MRGKIVKGIAGFYYVHVKEDGIYECKAKGVFRKQNVKPLVGDDVRIDVVDGESRLGNVAEVLERKSQLLRPAVANVDRVMVVFATANPAPNFYLLDRFLVRMEKEGVETVIGFNKTDISDEADTEWIKEAYERSGYPILFFSVKAQENLEALKDYFKGGTTVLAGPSGVGKSSLMNYLYPKANMQVGKVSEKNKRGRHTTRHSELFLLEDGYIMDTPGFSSLELPDMQKEDLKDMVPEFREFGDACKYMGCVHVDEPDCAVKRAVDKGELKDSRYVNYVRMYEDLKKKDRYA